MAETDEGVIDRSARYLGKMREAYEGTGVSEATIALHQSTWLVGFCAGVMPYVDSGVVEYLLAQAAEIVEPFKQEPLT